MQIFSCLVLYVLKLGITNVISLNIKNDRAFYRPNPLKTEFLLNDINNIKFLFHRKHLASPLQSPTG
jgi:hypothetical protein